MIDRSYWPERREFCSDVNTDPDVEVERLVANVVRVAVEMLRKHAPELLIEEER